jgi:methionine synthase I (cobalamin-dependent)
MGPTGALLLTGDISEAEMAAAFAEQAQVLAQAGVDALVVETMVDLVEARLAVTAAAATGLPVVACMAFGKPGTRAAGGGGYYTIMGVTPEDAVEGLTDAGAQVIGANCAMDAAGYAGLCTRLRAASDRCAGMSEAGGASRCGSASLMPIWLKPNAGVPELLMGRAALTYRTTPQEFGRQTSALARSGADFIGGCCGTGPAFIRALSCALATE